ncbi:NUDIX hydrolase [Thermoproteota archaeon]
MKKELAHYVVATAIILKGGKYLIAKRSEEEKAFPGLWTVPGGKLELSEYASRPKDAGELWYNVFENLVRREVKEEVDLKIKNLKYLTSCSFIRKDGIPTIIISLFADHAEGEVNLSSELVDHKWVTLEEAKNYQLIEGIYEELEMLDNHLKGNQVSEWKKN